MKRTKILPIGAKPRFINEEQRITELKDAIIRFLESNYPIPLEFIGEYNELTERLPIED